jgi:hypothetical protein
MVTIEMVNDTDVLLCPGCNTKCNINVKTIATMNRSEAIVQCPNCKRYNHIITIVEIKLYRQIREVKHEQTLL